MMELKPCPFCGSEPDLYGDCDMVKVRCTNYHCGCETRGWFDEIEDAVEHWNTRRDGEQE